MYLNEFYEDNAGNIFCFVRDFAGVYLNVIRVPNDISSDKLKSVCKNGWPDADPYKSSDYCGKSMSELNEEFDFYNNTQHIAEIFGYSNPIVFPERMGIAGRKLFKEWIGNDNQ